MPTTDKVKIRILGHATLHLHGAPMDDMLLQAWLAWFVWYASYSDAKEREEEGETPTHGP